VTIINDELNNKKNLTKLINEEKYENPKEKIIILIIFFQNKRSLIIFY